MLQNYHLIRIKHHGATNFRGSRVSMTSDRFSQRIYIDYDYTMNSIKDMAKRELEKKGFEIIGAGELKGEYVLVSKTFEALK